MAIYDDNWKSYAMYTISQVESSSDYGCIEKSAMVGIGIMQWSNYRSWVLLNKIVTDYPDLATMIPSLYDEVKPGSTAWSSRSFTQQEANEISALLVTDGGVASQNALWNSDCDDDYIPLLRDKWSLTDPKGSIFAMSIYHQSPRAFQQVANGVGNGTLEQWYRGALNNGIVGKYKTRQNTIKKLLDEWDGTSGKDGFGTTDKTVLEGGDYNPNYGNPDDTYATTLTNVKIRSVEVLGKQLTLLANIDGEDKKLMFYRSRSNLYIPIVSEDDITTDTTTEPTQTGTPATEPSGDTGNADLDWIMNKMDELKGTLAYSQDSDKRMNITGGYCDCSGLVWWLYNQRGFNIGTSTWTQVNDGDLIQKTGWGETPDETKMQKGDLCLFKWQNSRYQHVELYVGNNQTIGHGGDVTYGPNYHSLSAQCGTAEWTQIRRIINL